MWEGPLSLGVIAFFLALFLGPIGIGVGVLSVKKPPIWVAKGCFVISSIVVLGWVSWIIIILPIQSPFIIRIALIILAFDIVVIGLIELIGWIDSNKAIEQPIIQAPIIEPTPLRVRSAMIDGVYPNGTVLGGITWTSELRDLRVTFANESKYDYIDLDIEVHLHYPSTLIRQIGQVSDLPGVAFIYMGPEFSQTLKTHSTNIVIPRKAYGNNYRIRCANLFHNKGLVITIAVSYRDILNNGKITKILVKGQYFAQDQLNTIDEIVKVS
jgi:hypothetical protein